MQRDCSASALTFSELFTEGSASVKIEDEINKEQPFTLQNKKEQTFTLQNKTEQTFTLQNKKEQTFTLQNKKEQTFTLHYMGAEANH